MFGSDPIIFVLEGFSNKLLYNTFLIPRLNLHKIIEILINVPMAISIYFVFLWIKDYEEDPEKKCGSHPLPLFVPLA